MIKIKNGVVLYISNEEWILSKGYTLYKYNFRHDKKKKLWRLKDNWNSFLSSFKLTRRLFRAEITHLYHFRNDNWMCIAKKHIFKLNPNNGVFEKCCNIEKGSRPMNMCQSDDGTIYFGDYCYNPNRKSMRIIQSKDNGDTWTVAYEFKDGEINHIHGIFNDSYTGRLWVATGDDDEACIFGYTEDGFKTFVKEYSGSQQYRICVPLFTKDEIIFATDSQYEQNYIRAINRKTGEVRNIHPIQGSGIYAVQFGNKMMVSTTVEPSKVNKDNHSHLWYSEDGYHWEEIDQYIKDKYPKTYFQFGSVRFPFYEGNNDYLVYTGRALSVIDGKTVIRNIEA